MDIIAAKAGVTAAGHPAEGKLESFMGEPKLDMQQVFNDERLPVTIHLLSLYSTLAIC